MIEPDSGSQIYEFPVGVFCSSNAEINSTMFVDTQTNFTTELCVYDKIKEDTITDSTGKINRCISVTADDTKTVIFERYNNENASVYSSHDTNFLQTQEHLLRFDPTNKLLYLVSLSTSRASVGIFSELPVSTIVYQTGVIRERLGQNAKGVTGQNKDVEIIVPVNYERLNEEFTDIDEENIEKLMKLNK